MRSRPAFVALLTMAVLAGVLLFARLPNDGVQNGIDQAIAQENAAQPETPAKKKNQGKNAQKKAAAQTKDDHPTAPGEVAEPRQSAGVKGAPPVTEFIEDLIKAARAGGTSVLSNGDSYDDFASIAQTSDGTVFAAYAAYFDGHDQIRIHRRLTDGWWSTRSYVPTAAARSDIWMPQLAVDAKDRVWVIWSEQTGQEKGKSGNWDIYARPLLGDSWGKIERLTSDPKPDINPHVTVDAKKNIHVVWQAHPNNSGDVQYAKFDGESWSKPLSVTNDDQSDWYPHVAVDSNGTAWIAFDSYRRGDYDVYLTSVSPKGELAKVLPIAQSNYYEAHATVACGADGEVWVAWEQGGHNWGKDQGYWLKKENRDQGTTLGSGRKVHVACVRKGEVLAAPDVPEGDSPGPQQKASSGLPELTTTNDGRLWLRYRQVIFGPQRQNNRGRTKGWTEVVTTLSADGWTAPVILPASSGRISVFSRIAPANDGSLLVAYSSDARAVENYHRPIQDTALATQIAKPKKDDAEINPGVPTLAPYKAPAPPAGIPDWNNAREEKQVAAIRAHRTKLGDQECRIVRGDLHRHTELSWDVGPGNDGSYLDFYRYMIDVAAMDFGSLTDHQGGGHYPYHWWLTEKSADMYHLAPRFVPLYGYERSVKFPHGHRNVFHAYRGIPIFPFQSKLAKQGVFEGIGAGDVVENDTKLLYEYLKGTGGLCISHTSATSSMGTDWRDNDPWAEPVVEIYQGARNSSEALGMPRVHETPNEPDKAPGGYQEKGLLWNAYIKGYRLGTTSSSDHGSTHISYSMVFTPSIDRQAIIDSMRKRQTYGGTDNLIVEFWANGKFQGSEFAAKDKVELKVKVVGTSRIKQIQFIRNNAPLRTEEPGKEQVELTFTDTLPQPGLNWYYARVLQDDGEVAWSSPVWVVADGK
jgi:hypothetical protein